MGVYYYSWKKYDEICDPGNNGFPIKSINNNINNL